MASWQMVGSSKVGFSGLGVKIGGRPMPEMMRSTTVRLVVGSLLLFLALEEEGGGGGARVWETLWRSRTSPWMMARWASRVDCGIWRSRSKVWSLEVERDTKQG